MGFINYLKMQVKVAILIALAVFSSSQQLSSRDKLNQISQNQAGELQTYENISLIEWETNS